MAPAGLRTVGLLGTAFTMEQDLRKRLAERRTARRSRHS
jgi:aspartate/glutamate racemase